jgi:2-hydroxychromene-2-carboxylate isomerase
MRTLIWYFDFISPYACFSRQTLHQLPADAELIYQPVLLAGLLNHWGQKGPAEIIPKRLWTYRACTWWAKQHGIPFRFPAAHPFNSLPYLRLSMAAGNTADAVRTIFDALWTTGVDPGDPAVLQDVAKAVGVDLRRLADDSVKQGLRAATEQAAHRGIFGVPSFGIGDEVFWGNDSVEFAVAYLADPEVLNTEDFRRLSALPVGATRHG